MVAWTVLGMDDDADCVEHVWRFAAVDFRSDGSWSEYRCGRCTGVLWVSPGGDHPATA